MCHDSRVDRPLSFASEGDERATSIVRIRTTFDQTERLHSIDPIRHGAGREHDGTDQVAGAHLVRWPRSEQRRQHLELAKRDGEAIEDCCEAGGLQQVDPRDALQDMGHRHVEVRPFAVPLVDDPIDRIFIHAAHDISTWRHLTS